MSGDFNSRIGKISQYDECAGNYVRGERNIAGQKLIDFCNNHNLFVTNSAFQHPARHISTWENHRRNNAGTKIISTFSQIDYIICEQNRKQILTDARSYSGTMTTSDHIPVVCKTNIEPYNVYRPPKKESIKHFNIHNLVNDADIKTNYQNELNNQINSLENENYEKPQTAIDYWNKIKNAILTTAENTIGYVKQRKNKNNRKWDPQIEKLSQEQKQLRIQINNSNSVVMQKDLKKKRNTILRDIHARNLEIKEKEINNKLEEINNAKDTAKTFKTINLLNRKPYENPFIHDDKGKTATSPQEIYAIIENHFKEHFFDKNEPKLEPFDSEPRPLQNPITVDEVQTCSKALNNNRAPGFDKITGEMIKYGPYSLHNAITKTLNQCFERNEEIQIGKGILTPLQKPKKPKGPTKNLRPINLLPIIRKILSNITLHRIKPKVDQYLSLSQSAYRQFRSTADIVWAHRWLTSRIQKYQETLYITGIDMTAAFDTIKRKELLEILESIINEDELRIIRLLLSNTSLEIKIINATTQPFDTNIGSPQGDGLSGCLFNVYFEHSLRRVRAAINTNFIIQDHSYANPVEATFPEEVIYADDFDSITDNLAKRNQFKDIIKETLEIDNLQVNESKTEYTTIVRNKKTKDKKVIDEPWRHTIKIGSKLGDSEDIINRKQLSNIALHQLENIWIRKDKVNMKLKLEIYKIVIKSVLLYNCGTWAMTKNEEKHINAFHRQQLRNILNIKYPMTIRNKKLYNLADEQPISIEITNRRWKLCGHMLRLPKQAPASKAMFYYFTPSNSKCFRGRTRITIPVTLSTDLTEASKYHSDFYTTFKIRELKTLSDLETLHSIASDRSKWTLLTRQICSATEASTRINESLL